MQAAIVDELRKSLAAKAVAIGFICQILLGNYWMVVYFFAGENPQWLMSAFLACAAWIIFFGVLLLIKYFIVCKHADP